MQIKDVMTRNVTIISPDMPIADAAAQMAALDVGPLPVCDGTRLVGMITDRDIATRAAAAGQDPRTTTVREAMTPDVVYCFEDDDVQKAAELMQAKKLRRLMVLDRDKRFVGIVSLGDLAVKTGEGKTPAQTLSEISEPAQPKR